MSERENMVKRYPIISFAILSNVPPWGPELISSFARADFVVLPQGPSITAIIITAIVGGDLPVKSLLSRLIRWRFALC